VIDLVWVALIIIIVIAQLSQAKNKTQLRGRPFEQQRRVAPQVAPPQEQPARRAERAQRTEEPLQKRRPLLAEGQGQGPDDRVSSRIPEQEQTFVKPSREPFPLPDMRAAVVWSEIIAPPLSKRRGRS
jgi:hypothetical protein